MGSSGVKSLMDLDMSGMVRSSSPKTSQRRVTTAFLPSLSRGRCLFSQSSTLVGWAIMPGHVGLSFGAGGGVKGVVLTGGRF